MDFGKGLTNGMAHEKGTVLIIDNDLNQNISIRGALERQRYKVHSATNYSEGRRMIHEALPDVIVMEAVLPDGDGFVFCQEIRGQTTAYILFLTSRVGNEESLEGLRCGGDMYIAKPFHMPELVVRVDTAMRRLWASNG